MRKAGLAALLLGAALCIPGCGFEEGAGATVTVIQATPYSDSNPYPGGNTYSRGNTYT